MDSVRCTQLVQKQHTDTLELLLSFWYRFTWHVLKAVSKMMHATVRTRKWRTLDGDCTTCGFFSPEYVEHSILGEAARLTHPSIILDVGMAIPDVSKEQEKMPLIFCSLFWQVLLIV